MLFHFHDMNTSHYLYKFNFVKDRVCSNITNQNTVLEISFVSFVHIRFPFPPWNSLNEINPPLMFLEGGGYELLFFQTLIQNMCFIFGMNFRLIITRLKNWNHFPLLMMQLVLEVSSYELFNNRFPNTENLAVWGFVCLFFFL